MITIIISGLLGIYIGFVRYKRDYCSFSDIILAAIIGCLLGFILAMLLPAKTEFVKTNTYKIVNYTTEYEKVDNTRIGRFDLPKSKDVLRYVFYYEVDGVYKPYKIDPDYVEKIIICDDNPRIEEYEKVRVKGSLINYFSISQRGWCYKCILYLPKENIENIIKKE